MSATVARITRWCRRLKRSLNLARRELITAWAMSTATAATKSGAAATTGLHAIPSAVTTPKTPTMRNHSGISGSSPSTPGGGSAVR